MSRRLKGIGFLIFIAGLCLSVGGESSQAQLVGSLNIPNQQIKNYSGKRISLNFQKIPIRSLLQMIAEVSGYNFVVSDQVTGTMSLHVSNIPWDQAFDIVLKANGLGYRKIGDVLIIAPFTELAKNELAELKAQQQVAQLAPLAPKVFKLKYANAKDVAELLKNKKGSLLSSRGEVGADIRTNSLWVKDTKANLEEVDRFVHKLDIPAKQVLIEARIVSVTLDDESEIGARFGITSPKHLSGSLDAANQLAQGTAPSKISDITDRLNFNNAASPSFGNAGSIALAVLKIGNIFLDLELSALEKEHLAEVISTPRLITSNQKEALIEQGEEIPYLESTSSGAASVAFKKAVLSLRITPQITPDDKIILKLKVTQNKRSSNSLVVNGTATVPAISSEEVESQVTLDNGHTVVLGGIYKHTKKNNVERVPFLNRIPLVGNLFKHKAKQNKREELIVFVTPKIINAAQKIKAHG